MQINLHTWGPILHPAQLTYYTDACVVAGLQLAQSVLFPPPLCVGKLGNDRTYTLLLSST